MRGVVQAITGGWYAQCLWTLWVAPLALGAAYYVVPRVTGKVLPAYENALLGFWLLIFIAGFTGGRHLVGGPVPAWIQRGHRHSFVLLVHYIVVFLNLRPACTAVGGARFIGVGLLAYVLGGLLDAATSIRGVAVVTEWTLLDAAQSQLALYGAATFILIGALYFAVPRILGRPWASAGLVTGHWALSLIGFLVTLIALVAGGMAQSKDLADAHLAFADVTAHLSSWLLVASIGEAALLLGNLLFALNLVKRTRPCIGENATGSSAASRRSSREERLVPFPRPLRRPGDLVGRHRAGLERHRRGAGAVLRRHRQPAYPLRHVGHRGPGPARLPQPRLRRLPHPAGAPARLRRRHRPRLGRRARAWPATTSTSPRSSSASFRMGPGPRQLRGRKPTAPDEKATCSGSFTPARMAMPAYTFLFEDRKVAGQVSDDALALHRPPGWL